MKALYNLAVTLVITLNSIELSSQTKPVTNREGIAGPSSGGPSSGGPSYGEPLHSTPLVTRPRYTGPASLVIPFDQPEPHGKLTIRNFSYPPGFETKLANGSFISVPANKSFRSLTTANGYVLGLLNDNNILFGVYAEFIGKLHRFKIPIKGRSAPELMYSTEEEKFHDFRHFETEGNKKSWSSFVNDKTE